MSRINYFSSKSEADLAYEFIVRHQDGYLLHNEYASPSYKVSKVRNEDLWRIKVVRHFYGPRDVSCWLSEEEYMEIEPYVVSV